MVFQSVLNNDLNKCSALVAQVVMFTGKHTKPRLDSLALPRCWRHGLPVTKDIIMATEFVNPVSKPGTLRKLDCEDQNKAELPREMGWLLFCWRQFCIAFGVSVSVVPRVSVP